MSASVLRIRSGQGDYDVSFYDSVASAVETLAALHGTVVIVDGRVHELYRSALAPLTTARPTLPLVAEEKTKTLSGLGEVFAFLQRSEVTRASTIVCIGGGVMQDIVTFAAHCFHRGVRWVFAPTTLLSMADSCIGAKCGINLGRDKNQLGVFQSPAAVHVATEFLGTLDDAEVASGYGEILKLSLTDPAPFFVDLVTTVTRDGFRTPAVPRFIRASLTAKRRVIEEDEYERDVRRILNYGHTFGHALEGLTEFAVPHGIGVAWGLDCANTIAMRRGLLAARQADAIQAFVGARFAWTLPSLPSAEEFVQASRRDKKALGATINLVLLHAPGDLRVVPAAFDSRLVADVRAHLDERSSIRCA